MAAGRGGGRAACGGTTSAATPSLASCRATKQVRARILQAVAFLNVAVEQSPAGRLRAVLVALAQQTLQLGGTVPQRV